MSELGVLGHHEQVEGVTAGPGFLFWAQAASTSDLGQHPSSVTDWPHGLTRVTYPYAQFPLENTQSGGCGFQPRGQQGFVFIPTLPLGSCDMDQLASLCFSLLSCKMETFKLLTRRVVAHGDPQEIAVTC